MDWETVVTAYDTVDKAKNALKVLQNAGINTSDMSILDRTALGSHDADHVGLWRRLLGENVWEHEAAVYGDTLNKGGAILAARVPKDQVARVMTLFDVARLPSALVAHVSVHFSQLLSDRRQWLS